MFPIKTNREIILENRDFSALNREIESEAADLASVCSSLATGDDAARFVRPRGWSIVGEKGPRLMNVPQGAVPDTPGDHAPLRVSMEARRRSGRNRLVR